ncbi:MAG: YeeE/YedE thiosulfate transporter family protein [Geminicoccaceae bacterium]
MAGATLIRRLFVHPPLGPGTCACFQSGHVRRYLCHDASCRTPAWHLAPAAAGTNWLSGPWPILAGALALAFLNFATLWLAHRPWGITSGFALWGAKAFEIVGFDMASWPYWAARMGAVDASLFRDTTSLMNFGIMAGAMLAAGLAGRFDPSFRLTRIDLVTAVVGGLMLGYGARLAFGCNIGAYFSGIVSGSLHGWLWLVTGFAGNMVGSWLRPRVGLPPV